MANLVQSRKKIALLHRHTPDRIKETNAAFPYLQSKGIEVLTFKRFNRLGSFWKFWKSLFWVIYAPMLVIGKKYDVIYCDDSYPFYPGVVKIVSPSSRVVIRLGDLHLMYYYSGFMYKVLHWLEKWAWCKADEIIVISNAMQTYMTEQGFKSKVVLDPVDPADFPIQKMLNPKIKIVMFHGQLTKNKGVDILLSAARLLPLVTFWVVGDGPDRKRLLSIAPKNVKFHKWVPYKEIYKYISMCSIGVALRAKNEGNEYVLTSPFLQYGVMGKPCLATRRKVLGDYPWQFSSSGELAEKIRTILKGDQDGQKLRKYVLYHHSADKIGEEIWQILTQV